MSRNKFQKIKGNLHAADNHNLGTSKKSKVKPLYDLLNSVMVKFGILHENLSIDKSMVPYFGRHSCRQFIRSNISGLDISSGLCVVPVDCHIALKFMKGKLSTRLYP